MHTETPQGELKRKHELLVFNLIRQRAPLSRVELVSELDLSAQTITNIVRRFLEKGLVIEVGVNSRGNVGRNPINLDIKGDGGYAIGFCIERDTLSTVLINLKGEVVHSQDDEIAIGELPDITINRMVSYVRSISENEKYRHIRDKIVGVGIGAPGPIDFEKGSLISPPNFNNWSNVSLRGALQKELPLPIVLGNSSTVAAIGEHWRGKWESDSFLYFYWGWGIGGGLVTNNTIYRGKSGNELELGHIVIQPNGRQCECGGFGCLETYASLPAILKEAAIYGNYPDLASLLVEAQPGSVQYHLIAKAADYIGNCLVSALNLLDINLVVFGGHDFHLVEPIFLPIISEYVRTRCIRSKVANVTFGISSLREGAGAIGAASLVFHEQLLQN